MPPTVRRSLDGLPRDQSAGVVASLKQAMAAAMKAVRENATLEIRRRQKFATILWRRRRLRSIKSERKPLDL